MPGRWSGMVRPVPRYGPRTFLVRPVLRLLLTSVHLSAPWTVLYGGGSPRSPVPFLGPWAQLPGSSLEPSAFLFLVPAVSSRYDRAVSSVILAQVPELQ